MKAVKTVFFNLRQNRQEGKNLISQAMDAAELDATQEVQFLLVRLSVRPPWPFAPQVATPCAAPGRGEACST